MGLDMWVNKVNVKVEGEDELNDIIHFDYLREYPLITMEELEERIANDYYEDSDPEKLKAELKKQKERFDSLKQKYAGKCIEVEELKYWRKAYKIDSIMGEIYSDKGGEGDFNTDKLILEEEDLEFIIDTLFHLGEDYITDMEFFQVLLAETNFYNETVYYSNWW